jgi:hypothetical protein
VALETALCAAYPQPSRSGTVSRVAIAGSALVFPIIALRLWTRIKYMQRLWADDYATIAGAASCFSEPEARCAVLTWPCRSS